MFYLVCSNRALTIQQVAPTRAIKENHLFQVCEARAANFAQPVYAEIDFKLDELAAALDIDDALAALGFTDENKKDIKILKKAVERALH